MAASRSEAKRHETSRPALRPAIDGDGGDVTRWFETAGPKHSAELISYPFLISRRKSCSEAFPGPSGIAHWPLNPDWAYSEYGPDAGS